MGDPKNLNDQELAEIREQVQRSTSRLFGPDGEILLTNEQRLLAYTDAIEAEHAATMQQVEKQAYQAGLAVGEVIKEQADRIEALRKALQMIADGEFFEEENASVARAALEADKANGPG